MAILQVNDVRKTYANGVDALNGLSLNVEAGDFFGLLGPNGAGKSTLIGILTSIVRKSSGSVQIAGIDIDRDFAKAKRQIGVVPQEFNCNVFETVLNTVANAAGYFSVPRKLALQRAEKYLTILGLWEKRNHIVKMLSGGMKRRVLIARALAHEPSLVVLDEPTAGVDVELRRTMWEFMQQLNQEGKTIILTTHYLEEAEALCRNIAIMRQGNVIASGKTDDLLSEADCACYEMELTQPYHGDPITIEGVRLEHLSPERLSVVLPADQNMTSVISVLANANLTVARVTTKGGRLEELFIRLTSEQNT